jgi:hypothetical protein
MAAGIARNIVRAALAGNCIISRFAKNIVFRIGADKRIVRRVQRLFWNIPKQKIWQQ